MPCRGLIVAALNQSKKGATRWVTPMASDFACIICHAVDGARKGETISGWNGERGDRDNRGTGNFSVLGISWARQGFPEARRANNATKSAAWGTITSEGASHSGCTTTVAGRRPRRMSLSKARTFLYYGLGCAKDRVMN